MTKYAYTSYGLYEVNYCKKTHEFTIGFGKSKDIACGRVNNSANTDCTVEYVQENRANVTYIRCGQSETVIRVSFDGVHIKSGDTSIEGFFNFGHGDNVFAMCTKSEKGVLKSALGNAVPKGSDMLFDRETDRALNFDGINLYYDYEKSTYSFTSNGCLKISVTEDVYKNKYHVPYSKMNKNNTFGSLPPVGWMSWYAVKFNASEKTVLDNARWQSEHLKDYGANAVWVDWEWYHKGFDEDAVRNDGVDTFNPDPVMYPHGLKYVSDEIRKMGLIPSLWIGFTHETYETDYLKKHPEIFLAKDVTWAGEYFLDITHPTYLNDYLPKALAQVDEWGYEAVKFDTLPICMERQEKFHERLYDKSLTVYEAYRNLIQKTREVLGKDRYMLACSGEKHPNIVWAGDIFDAARIGGDIFKWDEFLNNCVRRTFEFYHMHNIMFYNDPDNIVLREEFNTFTQAVSRATFVSMLGMPVTFGDVLYSLPDERVNVIKRAIPSLDIRPVCAETDESERKILVTDLCISKPWENYNVISVFNTEEKETDYSLPLDDGQYHIYDFWNQKYMGVFTEKADLKLNPCETVVLSVRKVTDIPQIVSTNRHITQGAAEIIDLRFTNKTLHITCNLVKNDLYKVFVNVPDNYRFVSSDKLEASEEDGLICLSFMPDKTGEHEFNIVFK